MVQVNVLGGYDNVTFPQPWTDQLITNPGVGAALESYGAASLAGAVATPSGNSYLAWSQSPEESTSNALAMATTVGWLTRVVAATGGPCAHLDISFVSGTITNAVFALYNGPSFAVGPLVWTADQHTAMSAGIVAMTWNGASSPASVNLVAGQTYWVYAEWTGTSPVVAGNLIASAALANANLTATASFANNALTLAAGAPTTLAANTTLTPQTSWVNTNIKPWYGLRA